MKTTYLIFLFFVAFGNVVIAQENTTHAFHQQHLNKTSVYIPNRYMLEDNFIEEYMKSYGRQESRIEADLFNELIEQRQKDLEGWKSKRNSDLIAMFTSDSLNRINTSNLAIDDFSFKLERPKIVAEIYTVQLSESVQKNASDMEAFSKNQNEVHSVQKGNRNLSESKNLENEPLKTIKVEVAIESDDFDLQDSEVHEQLEENKLRQIESNKTTTDYVDVKAIKSKNSTVEQVTKKVEKTILDVDRERLLELYSTSFNGTDFLVQVASLSNEISCYEMSKQLTLKDKLASFKVGNFYKYFIVGFPTYLAAKEKVSELKDYQINAFVVVKKGDKFISPSLFFKNM
jgi:succinate dehydrogenase flavin-adding protein (antitoxin of CptAB toxin-antitoxin module)